MYLSEYGVTVCKYLSLSLHHSSTPSLLHPSTPSCKYPPPSVSLSDSRMFFWYFLFYNGKAPCFAIYHHKAVPTLHYDCTMVTLRLYCDCKCSFNRAVPHLVLRESLLQDPRILGHFCRAPFVRLQYHSRPAFSGPLNNKWLQFLDVHEPLKRRLAQNGSTFLMTLISMVKLFEVDFVIALCPNSEGPMDISSAGQLSKRALLLESSDIPNYCAPSVPTSHSRGNNSHSL